MGFWSSSKTKSTAAPIENSGVTIIKIRENIATQEKRWAWLGCWVSLSAFVVLENFSHLFSAPLSQWINNREVHLNAKIEKLIAEAKQKNAKGDKRGALFAMKKKKLHEQEIAKIENVKMTLETQAISLEGAVHNVESVEAMKSGNSAMKSIRRAMGIDKVDGVLDDVRDEMEIHQEMDNALMEAIDPCLADEDELLAELYELDDNKDASFWPVAPSKPLKKPAKAAASPQKSKFALFA